ncbi:MAG TPA: hypothetical protein VMZ92_13895, partial [Planctomycetota bacterium]|nr:hypothetical protein [Planctomycetota bacterium]
CKVTVTQVRAGKELRDGKEYVDPELPKNDERALKREYKKTYKSYELLAKDNSSAGFNEPLSLPLANGKTLILSFESHRQAWINMKLQIGADVRLMRVSSGQRGLIAIRYAEEGDDEGGEDALVIILCPRLVQATRQ